MHAPAERREDADAPIADLVAETLDDDRAVGRNDAGRALLLAQELDEIPGRAVVEPFDRRLPLRQELARELADRGAELVRPSHSLAFPERHRAGNTRRRRDEHAVARDVVDPPR